MTCLAHPPFPLPCPMLYHNTRINRHISIPSAHLHTPPHNGLTIYIHPIHVPTYTQSLFGNSLSTLCTWVPTPTKGTIVLKSALQVVGAGSLPIEVEANLGFHLALALCPGQLCNASTDFSRLGRTCYPPDPAHKALIV